MHCSQFSIVRAVKISRNLVMAVKKKGTCAHKECAQVKKPCFTKSVNPRKKMLQFCFIPIHFSPCDGNMAFLIRLMTFLWLYQWPAVSGSNHDDDGDTIVITLRGRVSFLYILQPFSSHQRYKMALLCSRMDGKRLTTNFQFFSYKYIQIAYTSFVSG